jgi:predicted phosphoribosyltransferase
MHTSRCRRRGGAVRPGSSSPSPSAAEDTLIACGRKPTRRCGSTPPVNLGAVGFFYRDFHQLSAAEVSEIIARAAQSAE